MTDPDVQERDGVGVDAASGRGFYGAGEHGEVPAAAIAASLGCGNPTAVADLKAGETVLDLAELALTHEVAPGMHAAIVRAAKPAGE